uniref:Core shell protein Gag P30 domain-containing protein n=1 Tax=Micrurus spixii TaxID=129469 RepID=A0A2D4NK99_9SAUR
MNMPSLQADPIALSESLDLFLGPNIYTFVELQHILGYLFSTEERVQIRKAAMAYWDKSQTGVNNPPSADLKFPLTDPEWDNNNPEHRGHMKDHKRIILQGVKHCSPSSKEFS